MEDNKSEMNREYSRNTQHILIMQCIFQYLFYLPLPTRPTLREIIENVTQYPFENCDRFIKSTFASSIKNCQEAVDKISTYLVDWEFSRLSYVDQAILILGYIEMVYSKIPAPVVINVCINIAQRYSTYDAHRYINGVLDRIKDELL